MLQLTKNKLVTGVARDQIEVRAMEVDYYVSNYGTMTGQAAMLAGFAFTLLTTPMPEDDNAPGFTMMFVYLSLVCVAVGLELSCIILCTYLSVWAPSLALRGKDGSASLHKAVDCLKDYQVLVFLYFMSGWVLVFITSILQVWIYYQQRVAIIVTGLLLLFIVAIVWYSIRITQQLMLHDTQVCAGKIEHLMPYEFIGDIDAGLHGQDANGTPMLTRTMAGERYCPVHETQSAYWTGAQQ